MMPKNAKTSINIEKPYSAPREETNSLNIFLCKNVATSKN